MRACGVWLLAVVGVVACGCGDSAPKGVAVSGTVTVNGKELAEGEVMFEPAEGKGTPEQAIVKGGKFTATLTPGAKKVKITAWRPGKGKADAVMGGTPPPEQWLPKRYNTETTLAATVEAGKPDLTPFALTEP